MKLKIVKRFGRYTTKQRLDCGMGIIVKEKNLPEINRVDGVLLF